MDWTTLVAAGNIKEEAAERRRKAKQNGCCNKTRQWAKRGRKSPASILLLFLINVIPLLLIAAYFTEVNFVGQVRHQTRNSQEKLL